MTSDNPARLASYVIILSSIHYVLKAEQLLKEAAVAHDVVPVPREVSADCGMAIVFDPAALAQVQALLAKASITIARIHRREADGSFTELNWMQ